MSMHTIWVPPGWSAEQTWEQISHGQLVPTAGLCEDDGEWLTVEVEGVVIEGDRVVAGRLVRVARPTTEEDQR